MTPVAVTPVAVTPVAVKGEAMRFSLRLDDDLRVTEFAELAAAADDAGFDQVWVSHDLFWRSAPVLVAAAAAVTKRVKLGIGIVEPVLGASVRAGDARGDAAGADGRPVPARYRRGRRGLPRLGRPGSAAPAGREPGSDPGLPRAAAARPPVRSAGSLAARRASAVRRPGGTHLPRRDGAEDARTRRRARGRCSRAVLPAGPGGGLGRNRPRGRSCRRARS